MASSYRALCSDFYINQKMSVKLDLPRNRETVLDMFERVRKQYDSMSSFKRYSDELALESEAGDSPHRWLAIRSNTVRSGVVNPDTFDDAYGLHKCVLETAPYYLSISPLDIEYIELLYGFDLAASGNHDAIVAAALLGDSPLGALLDIDDATPVDFQPMFGMSIRTSPNVEAHFEVKTRGTKGESGIIAGEEPISVYLTLRRHQTVAELGDLPDALHQLAELGRELTADMVVPSLLMPIREAIVTGEGA